MGRIIVPIDLGGSPSNCHVRPPLRTRPTPDLVSALIDNYRRRRDRIDEIAFFHGGLPTPELLQCCGDFPVRLAINPKDLSRERARWLTKYNVCAVELEFLSFSAKLIHRINRGYHPSVAPIMIDELQSSGIKVGVLLSPGLPGGSHEQCLEDAERCVEYAIDFVRICPLLVFAKSTLATWYKRGAYTPLSIDEVVYTIREMTEIFHTNNIDVIRIGWQPKQDFSVASIAGPVHPNLRALVEYNRFFDRMAGALCGVSGYKIELLVNPKDISWVKGECGDNIRRIRAALSLEDLRVIGDTSVPRGEIQWRQL